MRWQRSGLRDVPAVWRIGEGVNDELAEMLVIVAGMIALAVVAFLYLFV